MITCQMWDIPIAHDDTSKEAMISKAMASVLEAKVNELTKEKGIAEYRAKKAKEKLAKL